MLFRSLLAQGRTTSGRAPAARRPFVVTMVGGGGDGLHLARAAAAARVPEGMQHLVVTGPQMPSADRRLVEAAAGESTRVTARVADGLSYLTHAEAAVTMGGYNTMAEVLTTDTHVLVAPRTTPRTEQLIRVRGLARAGAVDMIDHALVDPEAVGDWLAAAVADPGIGDRQAAARRTLDLAGLDHVVDLAASLSARPAPRTRAAVPAGAAPAPAPVAATAASVPTPGVLRAAI